MTFRTDRPRPANRRRVALLRPPRVVGLVLLMLCGVGATPVRSGSSAVEGEDGTSTAVDDASIRAARVVDRGLEYLAAQQNEDRSFSIEPGEDAKRAPLAVTAIAALSFMAGGSTMGRGPYHEQVRTSIEFLLDHLAEVPPPGVAPSRDGAPPQYGYFTIGSDDLSKLHGHGFATLAVAQAYGTLHIDATYNATAETKARLDQRRMREALSAATRLIEKSQSDVGGWYYRPYEADHEGSMTVLMIQALRAARDVGIDVDKGVIDRAIQYIHKSQKPDNGGFRYHLTHNTVSYPLTAAAVATLNATGTYDSTVIDRGIDYMRRNDPILNADRGYVAQQFPYYGRLYAAQAYYVYRDRRLWNVWYPRLVERLEEQQHSNGRFESAEYGRVYATAMSCLVLEIPFQYLPIFQK